ncbi:MAG: hypothetical protein WCJ25_03365 [Candidatus Moraniibacteriota bacterium]
MKRSWEIRFAVTALTLVTLAFSLFAVLFFEERKRTEAQDSRIGDLYQWLRFSDETRKRYYDGLAAEREQNRKMMADAKAQYDDLTAKQPDLVKAGQQQVTKVVNETVPVQVPVTTRATKTS